MISEKVLQDAEIGIKFIGLRKFTFDKKQNFMSSVEAKL
jgi:hypothetical protein